MDPYYRGHFDMGARGWPRRPHRPDMAYFPSESGFTRGYPATHGPPPNGAYASISDGGSLGGRAKREDSRRRDGDGEGVEGEGGKPFSTLEYMIATTGWQGPGKMYEAPYKLLKVLWLLAFLACTAVMVVQLVALFQEFFDYPVKTQVKLRFNPLPLPSVTLCNVNPVRLSHAANLSCQLQTLLKLPEEHKSQYCIDQNVSVDYFNFEDYYDDDFGDEVQEGLDDYFARRQQIGYALAEENRDTRIEAGHQIEDMVVDCTFLGRECSFRNVTPFLSKDYGNCYTYSNPGAKARSSGPDAALDLTLNLEAEEFVSSYKTGYGLRLVLHEHGTRAFPSSQGFIISAGTETNIGVTMTKVSRQGGRYGDCKDDVDLQKISGYKYTIKSCRDLCLLAQYVSVCRCEPLEDETDFTRAAAGPVKYCVTEKEYQCAHKVYDEYYNKTGRGEDPCTCGNPCKETIYTPVLSSRLWPVLSYVKTLEEQVCRINPNSPKCDYAGQPFTVEGADIRRASFARVRLYYEQLNYEEVEESPFYDVERFLSDIGGTLGLWLGMTVLAAAEILELLAFLLIRCCRSLRASDGKGSARQSS